VEGFLKFLRKPPFTPPFGDLILVAHGHYFGAYEMQVDHKHGSPTQFEELVEADLGDSIRLTAADLEQPDGSTSTITVHLRGCNIGVSRPFVEKLQKAMTPTGGTLNMTAPLHFNEFAPVTGGYLEYLAYDFRVTSPTPFKNQAAVIVAFNTKNPKYQFLNGQYVPLASWKAWIPAAIHPSSDQSFITMLTSRPPSVQSKPPSLSGSIGMKRSPLTGMGARLIRESNQNGSISCAIPCPKVPTSRGIVSTIPVTIIRSTNDMDLPTLTITSTISFGK
jgi:hypothetical protein